MNKRGFIKPRDLGRTKAAIARNLDILEQKLKRFRSSSPEKWVEEVAQGYFTESSDLESVRSTSEEELSSSLSSEELIKTIAENENFIKQKIGGIEDELRVLSTKAMPDGIISLQEDLQKMDDGLIGLQEVVRNWDVKSGKPTTQVQDGLNALQNALIEMKDDARILISNDSLLKSSKDLQLSIEDSLNVVRNIESKINSTNVNQSSLEMDIENVQSKFKNIKAKLDMVNEQSTTLIEVHKGLETAKEEVKTKMKDMINVVNKSVESSSDPAEFFANLGEEDFQNLDTMLSYEITDFILRREEQEIYALREDFAESLNVTKNVRFEIDNKVTK